MQNSAELLERVKDYKPSANIGTYEEFIGGNLHMDFRNEVLARIEDMRDFNEFNESKQYLETRGGMRALRDIMNVFETLLENRKADLEEEQNG